ncbi:GroES-like protein [Suillus subaureus]|uniref:GroES-like protein n=1 Tax=Suillus subaureus TaxID=48587 RepID=A0A9P7EMB8_9AGAM|nr:GroES-like protein [Suillus subaureus]KAG1826025.1 GroES-like protein [Suillus subaureus]
MAKEVYPNHLPDKLPFNLLTQRASRCQHSAIDVRVIDASIPDITELDDVIVKVTGTTICGSDLHLYHGEIMHGPSEGRNFGPRGPHRIFSEDKLLSAHMLMGVVDRIGPNVKNLTTGQRVVASLQIACGNCRYCKEGHQQFNNYMYGTCDAGFFGYCHFTSGFPGGQAEYVRVPLGEVNLPISNDVSDEEALYLSDILPTSYHCVVDSGVQEGDIVGIWGPGPIGQCSSRIIAIDQIPERLKRAREQGCEVINLRMVKDVSQEVHEMVPGGQDFSGTFHELKTLLHKGMKMLMLETDVPETANDMIVSVRKVCRCGLIAAYAGFTNGFNIGALIGKAPVHKYWREILYDHIMTGKLDPKFMISHRVPLEDMAKLYAAFGKRIGGVEKVFVETRRVDDWAR